MAMMRKVERSIGEALGVAALGSVSMLALGCESAIAGGDGGTTTTTASSASGGVGGASTSSSTSSGGVGGTGGVSTSSSTSGGGAGGVGGMSTSSSASSGGGTGGASSSSSTSGGCGVSTSSSTSSGAGGATTSSSASSAGGGTGGAGGAITCPTPGNASPGDVVWTTPIPLAPFPPITSWSFYGFAVGSTGNVFVANYLKQWTPAPMMTYGNELVSLAEVDASGALVFNGQHSASGWPSAAVFGALTVAGPDHFALTAEFSVKPMPFEEWSSPEVVTNTSFFGWPPGCYANVSHLWGFRDVAGNTLLYGEGCNALNDWPGGAKGGTMLLKFDPEDNPAWALNLTPGFNAYGLSVNVAPDTGTTYVTGPSASGIELGCGPIPTCGAFAGAIDAAGICRWSRPAGASASVVGAGASDYLLGSFAGTLDVGCGPMTSSGGGYLAKIDAATGTCVWSRAFSQASFGVAPLPTGEVLIRGSYQGTVDLGCGPLPSSGGQLVAKLDASGACVWSKSFPSSWFVVVPFPAGDIGVSIAFGGSIDLGCGPLIAAGTRDLALVRLDGSTGACLWSRSFGAPGASVGFPNPAISSALGHFVVGADLTGGPVDFGGGPISDASFVVELDGAGAFRFQHAEPASSHARFALDPCGYPLVLTACSTCGPGGADGETLTKLAP